jgi:transcriptional regulator with XRE-family HTH domain
MPPRSASDERPSRVHRQGARYLKEARALGARVRQLREAAGLTLEAAAERADLDWKHLQKVEAGTGAVNLTLVTLVRIAAGLRVELSDLFVRDARRARRSRTASKAEARAGSAKRRTRVRS